MHRNIIEEAEDFESQAVASIGRSKVHEGDVVSAKALGFSQRCMTDKCRLDVDVVGPVSPIRRQSGSPLEGSW